MNIVFSPKQKERKRYSLKEMSRAFYSDTPRKIFVANPLPINTVPRYDTNRTLDEVLKEMLEEANGMSCKKCNVFNEYVTTPNQSNGSYVCYRCRSGW